MSLLFIHRKEIYLIDGLDMRSFPCLKLSSVTLNASMCRYSFASYVVDGFAFACVLDNDETIVGDIFLWSLLLIKLKLSWLWLHSLLHVFLLELVLSRRQAFPLSFREACLDLVIDIIINSIVLQMYQCLWYPTNF